MMKAKREVLQGFQQQGSATIQIPREHHRHLLGKGGSKLQDLEKQTSTKITNQLLKIYVDADTNTDSLVNREDLLILLAATLPSAFGYALTDSADSAIISMINFRGWRMFHESLDEIVKHETYVDLTEWIEWCIKAEARLKVRSLLMPIFLISVLRSELMNVIILTHSVSLSISELFR